MTILITGATGFIGRYVVEELLRHKVSIVAMSTDKNKASSYDWFHKVTYIEHRIGEQMSEITAEKLNSVSTCIHLAWDGLPDFKNELHLTKYAATHFDFLRQLVELGIHKLTVTGTCLEYGMIEGELHEEMSPAPTTAYGKGKWKLYNELIQLQKTIPFELDWLRLFYMYGEGQHPKSLLAQLDYAIENNDETFNMSEGEQKRDYLHVSQVAQIIVKLALNSTGSGIVNCASGKPIKIIDFVKSHIATRKSQIKFNPGFYEYPDYEPFQFWGSTVKLNKQLHD